MRVTSYTAASSGKSPNNPRYGITASGLPAGKGVVAVDRNIVPWKSEVYLEGYGVETGEVLMVAAHKDDLHAARACGAGRRPRCV